MGRYLIALDQGTTSSRAIVFTERGEIVASHAVEFPQHYPHPGWVEHDPEDILQSQIQALQEAVKLSGVDPSEVAAIGITNQRETTFLWDRRTGKCVGNAIVWQCRRTARIVEDLTEAGYRLCRQMIDSGERFTAVFAVKDMLAIGALGALKDAGIRVPEEVSVVGYDGIDAAGLPLIGLTTVAQPRQEMAEAIMDILLRHAEEPSLAPEHFLAKPELMLRSSTRAL